MWLFLKSTYVVHPCTPHEVGTPLENSGTPWGVRYTRLTSNALKHLRVIYNNAYRPSFAWHPLKHKVFATSSRPFHQVMWWLDKKEACVQIFRIFETISTRAFHDAYLYPTFFIRNLRLVESNRRSLKKINGVRAEAVSAPQKILIYQKFGRNSGKFGHLQTQMFRHLQIRLNSTFVLQRQLRATKNRRPFFSSSWKVWRTKTYR